MDRTDQLVIRRAAESDAAAVWQLRIDAILAECADHYSAELLQRWTDGEPTERFAQALAARWHVATIDERIVASGLLDPMTGQIDGVFVRPELMRQGIATRMLQFLEGQAVRQGLTQLTLQSTLNAAVFYRRQGFIGDAVDEYESPRGFTLACVPMTKSLKSADEIPAPSGEPRA